MLKTKIPLLIILKFLSKIKTAEKTEIQSSELYIGINNPIDAIKDIDDEKVKNLISFNDIETKDREMSDKKKTCVCNNVTCKENVDLYICEKSLDELLFVTDKLLLDALLFDETSIYKKFTQENTDTITKANDTCSLDKISISKLHPQENTDTITKANDTCSLDKISISKLHPQENTDTITKDKDTCSLDKISISKLYPQENIDTITKDKNTYSLDKISISKLHLQENTGTITKDKDTCSLDKKPIIKKYNPQENTGTKSKFNYTRSNDKNPVSKRCLFQENTERIIKDNDTSSNDNSITKIVQYFEIQAKSNSYSEKMNSIHDCTISNDFYDQEEVVLEEKLSDCSNPNVTLKNFEEKKNYSCKNDFILPNSVSDNFLHEFNASFKNSDKNLSSSPACFPLENFEFDFDFDFKYPSFEEHFFDTSFEEKKNYKTHKADKTFSIYSNYDTDFLAFNEQTRFKSFSDYFNKSSNSLCVEEKHNVSDQSVENIHNFDSSYIEGAKFEADNTSCSEYFMVRNGFKDEAYSSSDTTKKETIAFLGEYYEKKTFSKMNLSSFRNTIKSYNSHSKIKSNKKFKKHLNIFCKPLINLFLTPFTLNTSSFVTKIMNIYEEKFKSYERKKCKKKIFIIHDLINYLNKKIESQINALITNLTQNQFKFLYSNRKEKDVDDLLQKYEIKIKDEVLKLNSNEKILFNLINEEFNIKIKNLFEKKYSKKILFYEKYKNNLFVKDILNIFEEIFGVFFINSFQIIEIYCSHIKTLIVILRNLSLNVN